MLYLSLLLFSAAVVALDQLTKYLTVSHIPLGGHVPVLPGVAHLTYVQNTGAAFSMLEGQQWFFYIVTAVFLTLVVVCVAKKWLHSKASLFSLAAITGGAVGNLIDRVMQGFVVDMIEVEFVRFAVFNVADCFITCGAVALVLFVFLEDRKEKKSMILTVTEDGRRLDAVIAELTDLSRSAVQKLLEDGQVLVNGSAVKKNYKPVPGDEISLTLPEPEVLDVLPENIPLDVVFEDADVIVVNKPKGLVVHPAPGHSSGTLVNALMYRCGDSLSGIGGVQRPGIVHRIDKDTSGLLIVAKNDFAHQHLSSQLKDHTLARTYECIATGNFREDSGTISAPIGRHPADRKKMTVTEKNSKEAVTHWEVLARYKGFTHLRCRLETGRTHQIRVHLAYKGHPIAGDPVYGKAEPGLGLTSQCLHAVGLTFLHPRTGEPVNLSCPLPPEFETALEKLQIRTGR